jgi:hypothetical protein
MMDATAHTPPKPFEVQYPHVYDLLPAAHTPPPHPALPTHTDAVRSMHVHVQVSGYPTLYFVKANDKKNPVSYDGERTKVRAARDAPPAFTSHQAHTDSSSSFPYPCDM